MRSPSVTRRFLLGTASYSDGDGLTIVRICRVFPSTRGREFQVYSLQVKANLTMKHVMYLSDHRTVGIIVSYLVSRSDLLANGIFIDQEKENGSTCSN